MTVDLDSPLAEHHMDLTSLGFSSDAFDLIICSHVLELIPDDHAALSEMRRVLEPAGLAILQHPVARDQITYEDPSVTTPEMRLEHFGQEDHVRIYGEDLQQRIIDAGFEVEITAWDEVADAETVHQYGLCERVWPRMSGSDLYLCRPAEPGG